MLSRETFFEPLLEALPGFRAQWEEFRAEWADRPEGLPCYLLTSDLVVECSALLQQGREAELAAIFPVVERWLLEGDHYVKEVAIVGFLEDLQNTNLHRGTKPADFERFLGPEARYWWHKVGRFWNARELIIDDRPAAPPGKDSAPED